MVVVDMLSHREYVGWQRGDDYTIWGYSDKDNFWPPPLLRWLQPAEMRVIERPDPKPVVRIITIDR